MWHCPAKAGAWLPHSKGQRHQAWASARKIARTTLGLSASATVPYGQPAARGTLHLGVRNITELACQISLGKPSVCRRHDHSPSHQDRDTLLHCRRGFFSQHRVTVVANWVGDHGKGILGHPRYLSHHPRRLHKPVSNNRRRGNTSFLGRDGVVQTARRAAPSITDG